MSATHEQLREDVARAARQMHDRGLVVGTAGNVSLLVPDAQVILITPTSVAYPEMTGKDVVAVDFEGDVLDDDIEYGPSFEVQNHIAVYRARSDVRAIMHTHSRAASALAVVRRRLPPVVDEMVPYLGGPVEVAEYALSGSEELGQHIVTALADRAACLLANHGALVVAKSVDRALKLAILLEHIASIYITALRCGEPVGLPDRVIETEKQFYDILKTM